MPSTILMILITGTLLVEQNRAVTQIKLTFVQPAGVRHVVQLKTGSISGVVTGPNAHPVAGATVTALRQDATAASTLRSFSAMSDSNGRFRFVALPIGTYELQVGSDDMWLMKQIAKRVVVRNSENTPVEFQLRFIEECDGNRPEGQSLSSSDKTEIVKWMLEEELTKGNIPSYPTPDKSIVLSTENIESSWVPIIPGPKLLLLTPAEVQARADHQGDYMYLRFDKIRVSGSCVAVSICNLWADGTNTIETGKKTFLGESCLYYVFRKESVKWIGKFITGSIS